MLKILTFYNFTNHSPIFTYYVFMMDYVFKVNSDISNRCKSISKNLNFKQCIHAKTTRTSKWTNFENYVENRVKCNINKTEKSGNVNIDTGPNRAEPNEKKHCRKAGDVSKENTVALLDFSLFPLLTDVNY